MATKRAPAKKSTKKSAAKKSAKKSSKKSSKKSTQRAALIPSPDTGDVLAGFPPPSLRCIEACADAYGRCLAGGGNPQRCMKTFLTCIRGCLRRGGVGSVGGGGVLIGE